MKRKGTPDSVAPAFGYVFPAIRGVQAGREYYVSMCPLRLLPKLFLFDEEELVPELRAQRILNKARVPKLATYLVDNANSYVFSAITVSIDAHVKFDPVSPDGGARPIGMLQIPMDARFIINDGQHRRAAIEVALRDKPELADESIAVVFFLDLGLKRCQQMFADLNRHAIRPAKSLGVLYDHRDDFSELVRRVVFQSPLFADVVELERSTLSARSRKLFTLSAIYFGTHALLRKTKRRPLKEQVALASTFWNVVSEQFPEWLLVRNRRVTAGDVRRDFIHSHGIALQALGRIGSVLLESDSPLKESLKQLGQLDWSRSNAKVWEGRALIGGRVSKATKNVTLTTNVIKRHMGLPLSPDEQHTEDAFHRGNR